LLEFLNNAITQVALHPILSVDNYIATAVRSTEAGTEVICYDNWHLAYVADKEVKGKIEFSLPLSSLDLLAKEFKGQKFSLLVTESTLFAFNDWFELALALPQQDSQNKLPAETAFDLAKSLRKMESTSIVLSAEDLNALSSNVNAVYKKGENISFDVSPSSCKILLKSTHGKVSTELRCKAEGKIKFRTGYAFLQDLISKIAGSKVELKVVPEKLAFFTSRKTTFMFALLSNEE